MSTRFYSILEKSFNVAPGTGHVICAGRKSLRGASVRKKESKLFFFAHLLPRPNQLKLVRLQSARKTKNKKITLRVNFLFLAPGTGLEPATSKLTASCSTIELQGIVFLVYKVLSNLSSIFHPKTPPCVSSATPKIRLWYNRPYNKRRYYVWDCRIYWNTQGSRCLGK